jgi:hypothetical protein
MITMTTKTDTRTAAALEELIREGDNSITAEQLTAARERDRIAELRADAEQRRQQAAEATAHQVAVDSLKQGIETMPSDVTELARLAQAAEDALSALVAAMVAREQQIGSLVGQAQRLGIREMQADEVVRHQSGIGWRRVGYGGQVLICDGRRLTSRTPHRLLNRVVADVRKRHRLPEIEPGAVNNGPGPEVHEQLDALDTMPKPPERTVQIRYLPGRNGPDDGRIVSMPVSSARHQVKRGLAEMV